MLSREDNETQPSSLICLWKDFGEYAILREKKCEAEEARKDRGDFVSDQIYTVAQIKERLNPVFQQYNIRKAVLFGSYGKGCANKESDLDLLVDSGLRGLKFVGLIEDVRKAVDKEVDVLDVSHLEKNSEIDTEIRTTGVVIFEK